MGGAVAEEQRVLYLNAAFTGKASDTVLAIYGEGGIPVDAVFHEVMEQLTPIFAPPETPQAQHQRFAQLRLDRFASVALGVDAFNKALALQPLTPERRWLYFLEFLENCPLLVMEFNRQFPVDEPPPAFAVALQALLKLQDLFQAGAMLGPRGGAPVPVLAVHTAAEVTIAALEHRLAQLERGGLERGRKSRSGGGRSQTTVDQTAVQHSKDDRNFWKDRCYKCGRVGHLSNKCSAVYPAVPLPVPIPSSMSVSVPVDVALARIVSTGWVGALVQDPGAHNFMLCVGTVEGHRANILIDSGSKADVVGAAFVQRHALHTSKARVTKFTFGNGSSAVSGVQLATAQLQMGDFLDVAALTQCPLMPGVDVILGQPWLQRLNPSIDWAANRVMVGKAVLLAGSAHVQAHVEHEAVNISLISATAMKKERKQGVALEMCLLVLDTATPSVATESSSDPELRVLLEEFKDLYPAELPPGVPPDRGQPHHIVLEPGATIPMSRPYRLSAAENDEVSRQVQLLVEQRKVRACNTPFGAPVLLVKKKDGTWRMCVDYRLLNKITQRDRFPLPLIEDLLQRLLGSAVFSKIDLRQGFHQVPVAEESIPRTAFSTSEGTFEWLVMPMGLTNAPSTFQRVMQQVIGKQLHKSVEIFIDDNIVHTRTTADHLRELRTLFLSLRRNKCYLNMPKCIFMVPRVVFCGFTVSENEIGMEPDKVEAVRSWLPPTSVGDLRIFIGFVNYYRKYLRRIGEVASPLTAMIGDRPSSAGVVLNAEQMAAFEQLKILVTEEPVLRLFDPSKPVAVFADSSKLQAGSFWAQDHGRGWQPGAFESHKLSPAELNYSVRDKELLAIVQACRRWRHLLHGRPVQVFTDHESLEKLLGGSEQVEGRVARQLEFLSQFDLRIRYIKEKDQLIADALSRLPSSALQRVSAGVSTTAATWSSQAPSQVQVSARADVFPVIEPSLGMAALTRVAWDVDDRLEWIAELASDAYFAPIVQYLTGNGDDVRVVSPTVMARAERFQLVDGLLTLRDGSRVCVPQSRVVAMLREHHETPSGGHVGALKCHSDIAQRFFWPRMRKSIVKFVHSCVACQANKPDSHPPVVARQPQQVPPHRWHTVAMDWITGLPVTKRGFDAILTVTDVVSGRARFLKAHSQDDAAASAQLFLDEIYCQHGLPEVIISDRDPKITSEFWQQLMTKLGTTLKLSTTNHPQTDGLSERSNRTVIEYLRSFVNYEQDNWDLFLFAAEFSKNAHVDVARGSAPFELDLGRMPRTAAAFTVPQSGAGTADGADQFMERIRSATVAARDKINLQQADWIADGLHGRSVSPQFAVGDLVWVDSMHAYDPISGDRPKRKLAARYVGPFPISAVMGPSTYRLTLPPRVKIHPVINVERLRAYVAPSVVPGRVTPPPAPVAQDAAGNSLWAFEAIIDKKWSRNKLFYLVKWEGYRDPSWEPASFLLARQQDIDEFEARKAARVNEAPVARRTRAARRRLVV